MRSSTWGPKEQKFDEEAGLGPDTEPLSAVATEPARGTMRFGDEDDIQNESNIEKEDSTKGISSGRPSDPDSEATIVNRQISRPASQEEKARRKFLSRFSKKGSKARNPEDEDSEKKRPWYKGKIIKHKPFTLRNQIGATVFNSWINILILAAPVGIALNYAGVNRIIVFVVNFIAIVPLAAMLSFATEEIALHVGESLGGLLNATFG